MGRRSSAKADSLELLLDTICNTFGGVLFMAIMVVILLQMSGGGSASQSSAEEVSPQTFVELGSRLKQLAAEIKSFEAVQENQRRMTEQFAPEAIRNLIKTRNDKGREEETRRKLRNELLTANAERKGEIQKTREEIRKLQEDLKKLRDQNRELQLRIERERASRAKTIRLPVAHSAALKSEVALILRYGRMYVWHRYDADGTRQGLNEEDFVIVGEEHGHLVTRPKPTAGIAVGSTPEAREALRRRLQSFSPRASYLAVVVRPDSFHSFSLLRDCMVELGFEYRLSPQEEGAAIVDRGGSNVQVQ